MLKGPLEQFLAFPMNLSLVDVNRKFAYDTQFPQKMMKPSLSGSIASAFAVVCLATAHLSFATAGGEFCVWFILFFCDK